MSRAALLPAGADPFLNAFWLRHYRLWADEVDELRMQVCGQTDPEAIAYLAGIAADLPNVVLTFTERDDHGRVIGELIRQTTHELVLLCEDDAFIRRRGAVDAAFGRIERGETDIVGCPRTSATPDVADAAIAAFGNLVSETGEEGPALWPCFFFGRKADLMATDRHYGAARWLAGEYVPGLDYKATPHSSADTFVGTSYQLRSAGKRVHVEAEYRADLAKLPDWDDPPWFHVGSLSAGYGVYFNGQMSAEDSLGFARSVQGDLHDWNKRMAWWQRVSETADLPAQRAVYRAEIDALRDRLGIAQSDVDQWRRQFDRLLRTP